MHCLILAGGLGTRLGRLTATVPKNLVSVLGQPFASHLLLLLARSGVTRVTYCIGHLGDQIRSFVGDGSRWGLAVDYVEDGDTLLGTAGALRAAVDQGVVGDAFFVTYGDSYLPVNYRKIWQAFSSSDADAMMTVVNNRGLWDKSNVDMSNGRITVYAKAGQQGHTDDMGYIDFGLLCMTGRFVEDAIPPGQILNLHDVLNKLSLAGQLAGLEVTERFYEAGSVSGICDLERYLSSIPSK